jgi:hypothetical protein
MIPDWLHSLSIAYLVLGALSAATIACSAKAGATGYGVGDLFTIQGSIIPFAATEAERLRVGDPRPSLAWAARLAEGDGSPRRQAAAVAEGQSETAGRARSGKYRPLGASAMGRRPAQFPLKTT